MACPPHPTPPPRTLGARGKPPFPWGDASLTHPSQRSILGERLRLKDPKEGRERGHLEEVGRLLETPIEDAEGREAHVTAVGRSCARASASFL